MVSELHERSKLIHMVTSTLVTKNTSEHELSLQVLHQCSSLISLKLDSFNYLLWRSQMEPLIQSIDMAHHLVEGSELTKEITMDDGKSEPNPNYILWAKNDGLLTTWLLRNIETELSDTELANNILPELTVETENTALSPSENEELLTNNNESNSPSNGFSASDDNHSQTPEHQFLHDLPDLSEKLTIDLNDSGAGPMQTSKISPMVTRLKLKNNPELDPKLAN
ncbi:hypothetical protein Dsin_018588 [Dipteronia sinensis]|uniref:Retrotransposon Copia-like N-terminal domain-containing protein n=1 Tax=Dipteronia sinensis TaxID=43782 RepID=A0AAE0A5K3_9ROSI|nr:hypothetical protein Dsin_018588 [Dipteronia sinensis]